MILAMAGECTCTKKSIHMVHMHKAQRRREQQWDKNPKLKCEAERCQTAGLQGCLRDCVHSRSTDKITSLNHVRIMYIWGLYTNSWDVEQYHGSLWTHCFLPNSGWGLDLYFIYRFSFYPGLRTTQCVFTVLKQSADYDTLCSHIHLVLICTSYC